jgi:hypothetical protein
LRALHNEVDPISDYQLDEVPDLNAYCFVRDDRLGLVGVAVMRQPVNELPRAIGCRLQVLAKRFVRLAGTEMVDQYFVPTWHVRVLRELSAGR